MLMRSHVSAALGPALLLASIFLPACRTQAEAPRAPASPVELKPTPVEPTRADAAHATDARIEPAEVVASPPQVAPTSAGDTHTLVVRVFDSRGKPRMDDGRVLVVAASYDGPSEVPFRGGVATLTGVPSSGSLQLGFLCPGLACPLYSMIELEGAPGTTEFLDITPESRRWVGMRVVDHDGSVAASRRVDTELKTGNGGSFGFNEAMSTSADGMLWLEAWSPRKAEQLVLEFEERAPLVVDIAADLERGETRLPDVHLVAQPYVATGRVVNVNGLPGQPDRVRIERRVPGADGAKYGEWEVLSDLRTNLGDNGEFWIIGPVPSGELALRTVQYLFPDGISERVPIVAGQKNVSLVVLPFCEISGVCRVPAALQRESFAVEVVPSGVKPGQRNWLQSQLVPIGDTGTFRVQRFVPGACSITVRTERGEILSRQEVVLAGGEQFEMPLIDVDTFVQRVRVEAVDEHGARVASARVKLTGEVWLEKTVTSVAPGVVELLVRKTGSAVIVEADGCEPMELTAVNADQRVVLRAR
jgi:hypothetical protein